MSKKRFLSLTSFLLPKYLKFDRTQPFIFVTALLAFLGIGIGIMVLIVAMSIMNGVSKEFREKILIMNYPLNVKPFGKNLIPKEVLSYLQIEFPDLNFSPYLQSHAVIKTPYGIAPAFVFGIDFEEEKKINPILAKVATQEELKDFEIILGQDFSNTFALEHKERVTLFFTELVPNALGFSPISKRFLIQGFFHSGIRAYDRAYAYTTLQSLSKIKNLEPNLYDGIHIDSKDPMQDYQKIKEFLKKHFGSNYYIEGWWHQNSNLFSAMELEKRALFIVLLLIILMASLNIISSLLMVIMNRRKEIALLLSMGATKQEIQKAFFALGSAIGLGGMIFGCVLGFVIYQVLDTFPIISLPADVYGTTKLPLDFSWIDFAMIVFGSVCIVLLSSYYPAKKASKINLLDVLRNEV